MTPRLTPKRALAAGLAWALLTGAVGVTLALQGWRSNVPSTDVIPYIDSGRAFLAHADIPDRGVVTSLGSYAPPGLAWFVLPGFAFFSDPRLIDVPGTVFLYVGTLFGVFLLARFCFGTRCALLSVVLYGLSSSGLLFAGSMGGQQTPGPRGHPFFYVWMAYWICRWVARRDARCLAAACLTWLIGMWVFMEIAPAAFVVPVVWMLYRPPVRFRPLALAAVIAFAIWLPYLRFESARSFTDIRSQLLAQDIIPASYADALCDSTLTQQRWDATSVALPVQRPVRDGRATRVLIWFGGHVLAAARGLLGNFDGLMPGSGLLLFAVTLGGLVVVALYPERQQASGRGGTQRSFISGPWTTVLAIGLLTWAVVVNQNVVARAFGSRVRLGEYVFTTARTLQGLAALGGIALLMRRRIAECFDGLARRLDPASDAPRVLAISLVVPWLVFLVLAEPGREDRLLGLWPLEVIVLAFVAVTLPTIGGGTARLTGWLGTSAIALLVLINPFIVSKVESWQQDGWSGPDSPEIQVADYLAGRLQSARRADAAIGYRLFADGPPTPPWRKSGGRWKVGTEFDVALEYGHAISNLDQCVEGMSTQDEYRIVEVSPSSPGANYYFEVPLAGRLRLLDRIGPYEVYKRE